MGETKSGSDAVDYETRVAACSEIAHPLASKKLTKKILKTVKKSAKAKVVKRGIKEVVKSLRKGKKGIVVLAGDISPIDVLTHLPVLCEDNQVPYIYVPSKEELGHAGSTKRPTSCMMLMEEGKKNDEVKEGYKEVEEEVREMNQTLIRTVE
ncbi:snoRNA-binding protein [Nowakowskiella sp. JEL0407]|nr:snoRNA-binding protein [Nowakowskiella sp. JEL0407]